MSPPSTNVFPRPARAGIPGWIRRGLTAAAVLALGLWFFSPVRRIADPTLDASNYTSFAYFTAHGFQFGSEVMHVGGPYGFVHYGFVYGGNLFWKRLPLELLAKLVLGALVVWFFRRAGPGFLRWFWLVTLLLMAPLVEDLPYDLSILFAGLALLSFHVTPGRPARMICAGLAAFLAFLTLVKGTHAVLSLATFGLLALQGWQARDFRRLPEMAAAYFATLIVLLFAAGQNPLNFPGYLRSIVEQSSGYNSAMVLDESRATFAAGATALVALELALVLGLAGGWRDPRRVAGIVLLAGFSFIEWKHGFVRADGHVYIFFQYACVAAPVILLYSATENRVLRLARGAAAGLAFAAGFWGDGWQSIGRYALALRELPPTLALSARQIACPWQTKAGLDGRLQAQRRAYDLPRIRELAGKSRVDFFGAEHGYLTLNGLNYRPRPMGGGNFSVFNAWLQDANLRAVADPASGPEFFLVRVEPFDNRLLAQDDAGTLRALLALYEPTEAEQGMVLFRRRRPEALIPEPRLLLTRTIAFGQPVVPPHPGADEILAIQLRLPLNASGRLRALLYKAPLVFITMAGEGIEHPDERRVIPGLFERPVILAPVLENTADIVGLYGGGKGKKVRELTLQTFHPGLFAADQLELQFFALPRPRPADAADAVRRQLAFSVANVAPLLMSPPNAPLRRFDGLLVQMLEPPGHIRFPLAGRENELAFRFGIDPEAYERGKTDGVEFLVDLERPGQPPQTLFRRLLKPRGEPADRGGQEARLILPPFPQGSTVSLRTEPGPDRDGAWDWGYFTRIRLSGRGYIPAQFPRFSAVPREVDATYAGILPHGKRDLFMLNSPGSMTFVLNGSERALHFTAGLLEEAYSGDAHSDGVELTVELRDADGGNPRRIFHRLLNPRDHPDDRGDCAFRVDLPGIGPGSTLVLTVGPGEHGSNAWDWAYLESLRLE
ncbi:MAG: hypothetical protein JWM88_2936 [Verrucomicrobia bacterium]|nr:hypothetical protein [Verrucomicrobiota bacterium]